MRLCSLSSTFTSMFFLSVLGKKVQVLYGHKDWISSCCVSSDCSMIASVGRFDRVRCFIAKVPYYVIFIKY